MANCIPHDTALHSELQTLSQISTKRKGFPVFLESDSFLYKPSPSPQSWKQDTCTGLLHFCNNCVILKALIAAAAPDDILCGERACESSSPYSRTFAQKCINVIEKECFSLSHTLCMDLSKLDEDEGAFEALFENLPSDFDLSGEIKVERDIAVLHFQPDPSSVLTKTAQSCTPRQRKSSTAEISRIPPEVNFFWRFGEQIDRWEIDEVDALFPAPSHPCALMWYRFNESKSKVNTVKLNFRNPTGFVCQFDKPSQPHFAVATGAFVSSAGSILAPRLTVLPNMPTSLMMVLAFQLSTATIEFLINKKNETVKAIKINLVKIPCTDIEKYISSDEIRAINQVRKAISNVMALPLHNGYIPLHNPAITRIPRLLHDLLSSYKPNVSQPLASNLQALPIDNRLEGLVWEKVTPGISIEDHSTSYYGEFRCSLVGTKPYAVEEVSHDQESSQCTFPIKYTQSVSATLLAESKRIHEQRREDALNDLLSENTKWRGPFGGKMIKVKVQRDLLSKKVDREMRKDRKRTGKKAAHLFCPYSPSLPFLLEDALEDMVQSKEEEYLMEEDKIRGKLERKRKKKEKRKAEKKVLLIQKEKVMGLEEANWRKEGKKKTKRGKKRKRKQEKKLPRSFCPLFSPSPPLLFSPLSSPLFLSPLSSFPPALPPPVSLCSSLPHPLSPSLVVPFSQMGGQRFLHDQQQILLSEYCSEFRQKEELDVQMASTSKQKLPTQSDTAGLENSKGQTKSVLSVSQTVTTNGNGKENISKPLITSTLLEEEEKTCLTSVESNPSACGEMGKTSLVAQTKTEMSQSSNTETVTETANRCQLEVEVTKITHTKWVLKETADSCSSKQKVASKVPPNKISDQHSTGEHMAQLDVGFNSECGGQSNLEKEASLKETGKGQKMRQAPCSEKRVDGEKTQEKEVVVSKEKLEREKEAAEKEREKKIEAAISEEKVMGENAHAVKENKEERKSVISEMEGAERKKEEEKIEVQKEKEVVSCKKEEVEKEKQTTLGGDEKLSREEEVLREEDIREKRKKRRKRKKNTEVALTTSSSEQNSPAKSGIAGPDTCEENQMRSALSVSQFAPTNGQSQTATKGTTFLEDERKGTLTAAVNNATVPDERKKTIPETQTKSETLQNGIIESVTEMANRCQAEIDIVKETHTKKQLNETSASDITPTEQKTASKAAPNRTSAQYNTDEHMAQCYINECGGQIRVATLREETPYREKDLVQTERETAMTDKRIETEKKITLRRKEVREAAVSEKETGKEIAYATKEKVERATLCAKEKEKRKKEEESDKIQKKREVALCKKDTLEKEAVQKKRKKKIQGAISEAKVMNETEHAVKENEEERKAAISEVDGVERKKEEKTIEVQKEREVALCEKEEVGKEEKTTLTENEKLNQEEKALSEEGALMEQQALRENEALREEQALRENEALREEQAMRENEAIREDEALREENIIREKRKKRRKRKKTEVALATSNSEQNSPAKSGIAGPDTCQMRSVLSVSQFAPANGQSQTATKGTTFLEDKRKQTLTTAMNNATLPDERKKTNPKTQTKSEMSENGSIESMTEMANRCQTEIEVLKGTHTRKPLNETSASDITPTEQKTASKEAPNRTSAQCNMDEHMAQFSVGFINECGGQIRLATLKEETSHREKDLVQKGRKTAMTDERIETEKKISLKRKEVREAALSEKETEKEIAHATKEKEERAALCEQEKEKRKKEEESDKIQKKKEVALCIEERPEREKEAAQKEREKKIEAAISEEKVMGENAHTVKENKEERKAATSEVEGVERKKEEEKIEVQKEREVALCKKEKVEKEKKTTLRGNGKLSREEKALREEETLKKEQALREEETLKKEQALREEQVLKEQALREEQVLRKEQALREEQALMENESLREESIIREKRKKRRRKRKKKTEVALATSNSEQKSPANSSIAVPDTCEVSQMRSALSVSQSVPANGQSQTATKGITFLEDKRKGTLTAAMSNATLPDKRKKNSPKTQTKSEISENGSIESMTEMANRCQTEIEVLKETHTKKPLNETSVSDITPTEQITASKVALNTTSPQCNTDEHMTKFSIGFINECGGQIRLATLREQAPHREKRMVQKERETLKDNKILKTEEAEVKEEDEKREKRKAKRGKEENEREKEAPLAATNSEQEPLAHSRIAQPKGKPVVSVSQTVPTVGNGKKTVSKSLTASIGTTVCTDEGKRYLTIPTGHHERKKTVPEAMSENSSTRSTTRTSRSKVEVMEVTQTKKPLKETAFSDGSPIMQKAASRVASKRNKAKPGTSKHMAQFLVDFINECGGQTRLATLRREAFRQYQEKYYGQYTFLSKAFLRRYECFEISEDSSGVSHVRVVGGKRQSLPSTGPEPEKMEHETKKCLSYKPVCDIKISNTSEYTRALEGNSHSVPGSPEHIVQHLYDYLSTHFFPYGCPVSSLDALYQNEYKPKFSHSQVEMINADFLKEFSSYFVLQVGRTFVKLKEGVAHSDTSQLKGCPYTLQHVNDYFRRYLAQEGVVCTQQLQVLFSECYMKEFKMPQKPIIQFIQEDFFKRSNHLFVTFADLVVFRK